MRVYGSVSIVCVSAKYESRMCVCLIPCALICKDRHTCACKCVCVYPMNKNDAMSIESANVGRGDTGNNPLIVNCNAIIVSNSVIRYDNLSDLAPILNAANAEKTI